jgi:hypothetical protein
MKNLITLVFFMLLTYSGFSQISDNTFYLGGGISFTSESSKITERSVNQILTSKTPSASVFDATIGLGFFLNEKMSINVDFRYGTGSLIQDSDVNGDYDKVKLNILALNPYLRYLIMLEENKFGFIFDTGLSYGKTTSTLEEKVGTQILEEELPSISNLSIGIRPGIIYFPNEKIGLEASFGFVGYYSETTKEVLNADEDSTLKFSGFTIGANSLNPALQFGFRYYFQR